MSKFAIRAATVADCPALSDLALRSKAHWGYSAAFMAACREELTVRPAQITASRACVLVATEGPHPLAYTALEWSSDGDCELEALFVEPASLGHGIGTALLEAAKTVAVQHGACRLLIQADPNAEAFYLKVGAERIGTRESGSIAGRSLPLLALDLSL